MKVTAYGNTIVGTSNRYRINHSNMGNATIMSIKKDNKCVNLVITKFAGQYKLECTQLHPVNPNVYTDTVVSVYSLSRACNNLVATAFSDLEKRKDVVYAKQHNKAIKIAKNLVVPEFKTHVDKFLTSCSERLAVVAYHDGEIVGMALCYIGEWLLYIAVHPDFRNRGIGSRLLMLALQGHTAKLAVPRKNPLLNIARRLGFPVDQTYVLNPVTQ